MQIKKAIKEYLIPHPLLPENNDRYKYFLPVIFLFSSLVWWRFGFDGFLLTLVFLVFFIYRFEIRILAGTVILIMVVYPCLSLFQKNEWADILLTNAFFLLVMIVILESKESLWEYFSDGAHKLDPKNSWLFHAIRLTWTRFRKLPAIKKAILILFVLSFIAYLSFKLKDYFLDSDHDGLSDHYEHVYKTDPHSPDTDKDGLSDYEEVRIYKTDPLNPDTDKDGYDDYQELQNGYDAIGVENL